MGGRKWKGVRGEKDRKRREKGKEREKTKEGKNVGEN